jgi:quinol monooxygenase YgiN
MDDQFAVWATMKAQPGKEEAARLFLTEASRRLAEEPGTTSVRAMDLGEGAFAIFNSFRDAESLMAHVEGPTAHWVIEQQDILFVEPYAITKANVFAQMHKRQG